MQKVIRVVEVAPRDGLQNEGSWVVKWIKVKLIDRLSGAGMTHIEATSFVSPKWVPQLADATEVMRQITRKPGTVYSALVPNAKGFASALAAKVDEVVIFTAASETFSQKHINCSITQSFDRFAPVALAHKEYHLRLRGSISCALGCPYQGEVPVGAVADVVRRLRDLGCDEIDIADTIGVGTANRVKEVIRAAAQEFSIDRLAGHYHDTYGQALANSLASLEVGLSIFHSSVAGLGGLWFAPSSPREMAIPELLYLSVVS